MSAVRGGASGRGDFIVRAVLRALAINDWWTDILEVRECLLGASLSRRANLRKPGVIGLRAVALELSARREKEEQAFRRAVAQVLEQHKNNVDRITTQEEQLWAMSDDLVVLVRTSIGAPKGVPLGGPTVRLCP